MHMSKEEMGEGGTAGVSPWPYACRLGERKERMRAREWVGVSGVGVYAFIGLIWGTRSGCEWPGVQWALRVVSRAAGRVSGRRA